MPAEIMQPVEAEKQKSTKDVDNKGVKSSKQPQPRPQVQPKEKPYRAPPQPKFVVLDVAEVPPTMPTQQPRSRDGLASSASSVTQPPQSEDGGPNQLPQQSQAHMMFNGATGAKTAQVQRRGYSGKLNGAAPTTTVASGFSFHTASRAHRRTSKTTKQEPAATEGKAVTPASSGQVQARKSIAMKSKAAMAMRSSMSPGAGSPKTSKPTSLAASMQEGQVPKKKDLGTRSSAALQQQEHSMEQGGSLSVVKKR